MNFDKIIAYFKKLFYKLEEKAKLLILPGFDGLPLYDVLVFFIKGIIEGSLTTRASAIAFNFYIALFPALIFVFTLIPYIPIDNFQEALLSLMENLIPSNAFQSLQGTLEDIVTNQRGGLLSFGFFAALIFSTNGFNSMIDAFNATHHSIEMRSWLAQRLIAALLVIIMFSLSLTAVTLITFGTEALQYAQGAGYLNNQFTVILLQIGQWLVVVALFFVSISSLYFLAPSKKARWRFVSAGSSLATLMCIAISLGFSFYINNFGQYNSLYGSIGTILVILMWMYLNAISLLIGFELNTSISGAIIEKKGTK